MPVAKKKTKQPAADGRKSKKFSDEFVKKAMVTWASMAKEGKSRKEVAEHLGVHPSMLDYWRSKAEGKGWPSGPPRQILRPKKASKVSHLKRAQAHHEPRVAFESKRPARHTEETAELRKQIASLTEERDILKKSVMVFARGH